MASEKLETVVIGGGVVGLAIALELSRSGREVWLLEANQHIGMETSARNSEVIHAGLYYEPTSLKARSCIRGGASLFAYCVAKSIPHRRVGKLVLANGQGQRERLKALFANAINSGVTGLEILDRQSLASREPAVRADAALWSPNTGIIDSHSLLLALRSDLESTGGQVACNSMVRRGYCSDEGIHLEVTVDENHTMTIHAREVVNAAGLGAVSLARRLEGVTSRSIPQQHLSRGHYFVYRGQSPFAHLVYPLPDKNGLGIHGTLDLAGRLRFGPDAQPVEHIDYRFDENLRADFVSAIQRWYPEIQSADLLAGYTGIRPRLGGPDTGFHDFLIQGEAQHSVAGLVQLFGIESPGLTASLALAETVRERLATG